MEGLLKTPQETQSILGQTIIKLEDSKKDKNEYHHSIQHWKNQLKETQKTLEIKTSEFITIQIEVKILLQQLVDIKQSLHDTQSQIKLLSNEKSVLSQEKAQLQGQIKQMLKMVNA